MDVELVREPQNANDRNAIRVDVIAVQQPTATTTTTTTCHNQLGYLAKAEAQVLAPWMDRHLVSVDSGIVSSKNKIMQHEPGGNISYTVQLQGQSHPLGKEMLEQCFN
ncbi:hypothetical protein ACA910_005776 [Epithemia clementina (nom. ined.)]